MRATMVLVHNDERVIHVEDLMRLRAETQAQHQSGDEPISDLQRFLDRIDNIIAAGDEK